MGLKLRKLTITVIAALGLSLIPASNETGSKTGEIVQHQWTPMKRSGGGTTSVS